MADSYGANLQRWPHDMRSAAQALLDVSQQARACLDEARALDDAIAVASARGDEAARRSGEDGAALDRLRVGVAAQIAVPFRVRRAARWRQVRAWSERAREFIVAHTTSAGTTWAGMSWSQMTWIGMATGGSVAVIAGFLIGASYASTPSSDAVLGLLQPITF
jgi:hypothetical protein